MSMEELRSKLLMRGADSIKAFGRSFRIMDDDRSKSLSLEELTKGIQDFGLDMSDAQVKEIFMTIDKDSSGTISFDEFLVSLRSMSASRRKIVEEAFKKADKSGDGIFDAKDLERVYNVKEHPKYKTGEWDETQVFNEFLKSFEPDVTKRDGKNHKPQP